MWEFIFIKLLLKICYCNNNTSAFNSDEGEDMKYLHTMVRDGYMAFIRCPDNISIELLQKGEPLLVDQRWANEPNVGHW